jgi:hypothetical protein
MPFQRDIKFNYQGKEREATVQLDEESFDLTSDVVLDDGYEAVIFIPFDGNQWYEYKKGITELSIAIGKELDRLVVSKENRFIIRINHQSVSYIINVVPKDHPPLGSQVKMRKN